MEKGALIKLDSNELKDVLKVTSIATCLEIILYNLVLLLDFELLGPTWIEILAIVTIFSLQFTFIYLTKSLDKTLEALK
ncbi:hypothetical protein ACFO6R_10980 [Eubacterium multiforme]|uniref:Uncharacterized protein n=1 Tax=Eubacterium multiforme TaxID=83339 RepID=A0ABT9UVG9_9FIRM|nr:hypothetical protein [Eubacterium multiforme]